jgi:hypothetical protein
MALPLLRVHVSREDAPHAWERREISAEGPIASACRLAFFGEQNRWDSPPGILQIQIQYLLESILLIKLSKLDSKLEIASLLEMLL